MLEEARNLKAEARHAACDIAAISICSHEYYEQIRRTYDRKPKAQEIEAQLADAVPPEVAHEALRAMFRGAG